MHKVKKVSSSYSMSILNLLVGANNAFIPSKLEVFTLSNTLNSISSISYFPIFILSIRYVAPLIVSPLAIPIDSRRYAYGFSFYILSSP